MWHWRVVSHPGCLQVTPILSCHHACHPVLIRGTMVGWLPWMRAQGTKGTPQCDTTSVVTNHILANRPPGVDVCLCACVPMIDFALRCWGFAPVAYVRTYAEDPAGLADLVSCGRTSVRPVRSSMCVRPVRSSMCPTTMQLHLGKCFDEWTDASLVSSLALLAPQRTLTPALLARLLCFAALPISHRISVQLRKPRTGLRDRKHMSTHANATMTVNSEARQVLLHEFAPQLSPLAGSALQLSRTVFRSCTVLQVLQVLHVRVWSCSARGPTLRQELELWEARRRRTLLAPSQELSKGPPRREPAAGFLSSLLGGPKSLARQARHRLSNPSNQPRRRPLL